ncbi:unnamed protein product [Caenorhabditis brenneri]
MSAAELPEAIPSRMPPKSKRKPTFKEKNPIPSYLEKSEKRKTFIKSSKKPATFNLFKLTWVALEEVLKIMDHRDVFVLSLCSKNTFDILKTCKLKANCIYYSDGSYDVFSIYSCQSHDSKNYVLSAKPAWGFENILPVVRLGGMDVQCTWTVFGINYTNTTEDVIQRAVSNHIHNLFSTKYIDLELSAKNISKKHYPNITGVTDLWLYEFIGRDRLTLSPTDFEEILETYPDLKSIRFEGEIDGSLSADSRIFSIDNVSIREYHQSASFFWKNFKGRHAALGRGEYNETDVIDFARNWISGMEYCNLNILFVTKNGTELDSEIVLKELSTSAKEWDRPPTYEYWSRLIGTERHKKTIIRFFERDNFKEYMDFERETDQKMATLITLRTGGFGFMVWN